MAGLLFRSIVAGWLFPGFDEAYYYLYSQHLDWSYFDHPVMVALTTGFGPWITGVASPFTIRWGALLLHTGSLWLLYLTGVKLFNAQAAQLTLAIATIIPIFQIGFGVLTLPDSPLIFFWSASLYCAACEFFSDRSYQPSARLALLGVLVGLACLSKYHGFLLGFGLIGFCLTSPRHRRALLSPWAGLGLFLFIIVLFPLLFWNWQHEWISFRFQLSSRFEPEPGVPQNGYSFLGAVGVWLAGIAYLFPTMGVPLWWVSGADLAQTLSSRTRTFKPRLILWVSLPLTLGFTLLGGYQQILAGWPMPGFWGLTLLLGDRAQHWQKQSQRGVRRWLYGSAITLACITLLALLHVTTGIFQKPSQAALLGVVSPQNDPSTELIDVGQLRRGFADSPVLREALEDSRFVFTNAYYLGGLIDLALNPLKPIPVTCWGDDPRGFAFWYHSEQWLGENALYVTLERFAQLRWQTDEFRSYFRHFEEIGIVPIRRGGVVVEVFYVYRGQTLLKPYSIPFNSNNREYP